MQQKLKKILTPREVMRRLAANNFSPIPVLVEKGGEWLRREISWVNVPTGWVCYHQYIDAHPDAESNYEVWDEVWDPEVEWEFGECPSPHGWHNPEERSPEKVLSLARECCGEGVDPATVRLLTRDEIGKRPVSSPKIYWNRVGGYNGFRPDLTYWTTTPYGELPPVTKYRFPETAPYGWSRTTGEKIPCPEGYRLAEPGEDFHNNPVEAVVYYDDKRTEPSVYDAFVGTVAKRTKEHGTVGVKHSAVFVKLPEPEEPTKERARCIVTVSVKFGGSEELSN